MNWGWGICSHYERYFRMTPGIFFWCITFEGVVVGVFVSTLLSLGGVQHRADLGSMTIQSIFFRSVLLAPWIECLVSQVFPMLFMSAFKAPIWWKIWFSTAIFAWWHFQNGLGSGIAAGIVGGFYYAFTYVFYREKSFWLAFLLTGASHALHNLCVLALSMRISIRV